MLPIVLNPNSPATTPALPQELMALFKADQEKDFAGLGSVAIRRLKVGKMDFTIGAGSDAEKLQAQELVGVCIATAPYTHCVWYAKEYVPGSEPEQPDLIWVQRTEGYIPDALPEQFHKKIERGGSERWAFQILRRTVWARLKTDINGQLMLDLDNPFVFDLTSMNMYGKSFPEQNMYKWSGLISLCKRLSVNGAVVTPAMFPMQICIDPNVSVSGVVVFRPMMNQSGYPQFFDPDTIMAVRNKRGSTDVQEVLEVREKLEYGAAPAQQPIQPQPIQPQSIQPQSQPFHPQFSQPQVVQPKPSNSAAAQQPELSPLQQASNILNAAIPAATLGENAADPIAALLAQGLN